ncbi:MAG TPA: ribonuclease PH, partial [Actinobacteria bacterium]|nr:ribonuclease PH [Actinomycetota bacterium]
LDKLLDLGANGCKQIAALQAQALAK